MKKWKDIWANDLKYLILLELDILQRSHHSRPVPYVPLGQNATVSFNLLDLKIQNTRPFPHLIVGKTSDFLQNAFYDPKSDDTKNIEIISEDIEVLPFPTLEQPDPNLPKDTRQTLQKGEDGYK